MLKTRIFTAIVLLGLFLPALFWLPLMWWAAVMLGLTLICLHEWANLVQVGSTLRRSYLAVSAVTGLLLLNVLMERGFEWLLPITIDGFLAVGFFWLCLVPLALYVHKFPRHTLLNLFIGWALLGSLWLSLLVAKQLSPVLLLVLISTIWLADSAAYFAGKRYGKHKLAPAISPGKTWEGVVGALLAVSGYAVALKWMGLAADWWVLPGLWLVTVVGIYGDLFESLLKRRANLKDSGQFLPGHGGLLDRVDGVIPALPIGLVIWFSFWQQTYSF